MKLLGKFPSTRLRRNRKSDWSRRLTSENNLSIDDLILPVFLTEGKNITSEIKSMPGVYRYSLDKLNYFIEKACKLKIPMVALFPHVENQKKDAFGSESLNPENLVCRAIRQIKKKFNNIGIMCDVALDPYTSHGHDGILSGNEIHNDKTNKILIKQSLIQADAGCDIIAPSDMMDGRVGLIRNSLDKNSFKNVQILSYAVKYASSFYGPFRDAIGSGKKLKGNKKTYQMDFKNSEEALREVALDIKEGADFVMVKPGMPYMDIINKIKNNFKIPVFSYQVSGEYNILKNAINKKTLSENIIIESLICLKRAGSSAIVTYFAIDAAKKIKSS